MLVSPEKEWRKMKASYENYINSLKNEKEKDSKQGLDHEVEYKHFFFLSSAISSVSFTIGKVSRIYTEENLRLVQTCQTFRLIISIILRDLQTLS